MYEKVNPQHPDKVAALLRCNYCTMGTIYRQKGSIIKRGA